MQFTVQQIADLIQGSIEGNPQAVLTKFSKIEAGEEGGLSFLANPKYIGYIYDTQATAVLVGSDFIPEKPVKTTLIKVENPYAAFATLLQFYEQNKKKKTGIAQTAVIDASAKIGQNVFIGDYVVIGERVTIGDNVRIYPHVFIDDNCSIGNDTCIFSGVKIHSETIIGARCDIQAGAIIGSDGFGFASAEGAYIKIPQLGNVIIEDDVNIGALTCIDRSSLGSTVIGKGCKLDNLIQIAHHCEIGENTVMCAMTGVAGSTKIGKNCIFGAQVGVNGHIQVGDNVKVGPCSAVSNNVADNAMLLGTPAINAKDNMKSLVYFKQLPEMAERLRTLEKKIKEQ